MEVQLQSKHLQEMRLCMEQPVHTGCCWSFLLTLISLMGEEFWELTVIWDM